MRDFYQYNLLSANVGKSVSFRIGANCINPPSGDWFILPFASHEYIRLVYAVNAIGLKDVEIADDATILTIGERSLKYIIHHFRLQDISSFTIF